MSTAEGRSRPRLNNAADTKKVRRYFIGGSDAHIIMGKDEEALIRLWFIARITSNSTDELDKAIAELERLQEFLKSETGHGPNSSGSFAMFTAIRRLIFRQELRR